jgi:hypothetical protein
MKITILKNFVTLSLLVLSGQCFAPCSFLGGVPPFNAVGSGGCNDTQL